MGVVTVETSPLHWTVLEFYLCDGIAHILMAAETEVVPGLPQIELVLCCVRVVAFDAIPLYHDLMGTPCLSGYNIGVAVETDFSGISSQKLTMGGRMGVMTACAFSGLYRRMDRR
jgi:hypothetical protein